MTYLNEELKQLSDEGILHLSLKDPAVFELLVDKYFDAFLRKAMSILNNREDAQDVVQETFVRIYTAAPRFHAVSGASFSSWGYTILLRRCYSMYVKRKQKKLREVSFDDEMADVIPDTEEIDSSYNAQVREELLMLVSRLPEVYKKVVKRFLNGERQEDIASAEGISHDVVRTRIHRAKVFLKKVAVDYF